MHVADVEVAKAAGAALGNIGGPAAAKSVSGGSRQTKGPVRTAVADAGPVCAEGLLAGGNPSAALGLYDTLSRTDIPRTVGLAAMRSAISVETASDGPRSTPSRK